MKKLKLIKKLTSLTLIGGGILTSLPLIISSCSCTRISPQEEMAPSITADYVGNLKLGAMIVVQLHNNAN
jgi:hypothetical protein